MTASLSGKRIIIVLWCLELGGAERQAILLGKYLAGRENASVEVLAFETPGRAARLCEESGLPWTIVPLNKKEGEAWGLDLWRSVWDVAQFFRSKKAHIILSYLPPPNVISAFAWRFSGASACIWNQRSSGMDSSSLDRRAIKLVPWFIANSQHGADFLISKLAASPERVRVISNGIDLRPFAVKNRDAVRQALAVEKDQFCACMTANLTGYKDHGTLIRAWKAVNDDWPSEKPPPLLFLAGKHYGAYPEISELVESLGLCNTVRFLGQYDDIPSLLSAVDLGILSSPEEGCPNAVIEYMAAGLPVVGTDNPGIRETVADAGRSYLYPHGNDKILAGIIKNLAFSPILREKLGTENRSRIEECYSLELMCAKSVDVICEALRTKTFFRLFSF